MTTHHFYVKNAYTFTAQGAHATFLYTCLGALGDLPDLHVLSGEHLFAGDSLHEVEHWHDVIYMGEGLIAMILSWQCGSNIIEPSRLTIAIPLANYDLCLKVSEIIAQGEINAHGIIHDGEEGTIPFSIHQAA